MKHVSNNVSGTVHGSVVMVDSVGNLHITATRPYPHPVANASTQDVAAGEMVIQVGGKTLTPPSRTTPAEPDRCALCDAKRTDADRRYVTGNDGLCRACRAELPSCAICGDARTAEDVTAEAADDAAADDELCSECRTKCAAADDEAANDTDPHEQCWGVHHGAVGIVDCDGREI